ncbi:MAG TPA: glycosyltransferase family 1 protein [Bryobacteraceae bacterium]|nr:glycosyltransferase family 1 protein [Bryobacteraceae bacterium]
MAAAHPEVRFRFCYRPHRYLRSWRESLPRNARRGLLAEPLGLGGAQLFHGLNQRLPALALPRSVATFHDLFVMTSEYSTPEFRARFTGQARDAAARATAVIAVSEFTRQQVISHLGVAPERVHVVHHGIRGNPPAGGAGERRERVILSVGAIQKRKNIARLVGAFETVSADWRLALAGSAGYGSEEILARIAASPAAGRISVLGYISPAELASWYARCSVFAFPSLDEGFGMPVLEAMAAGAPVLTSNRSALPEVAGDAALLVDPENAETLGKALRDLTESEDLRRDLARRGSLRAQLFTWEKAVRATWEVYRQVLD